ncbi:hypothetical protein BGX29_001981 [Mortierella sp. GBA35]|nr:hypothetical protein BGX29_001981 [Mortierella sp. GBA35]
MLAVLPRNTLDGKGLELLALNEKMKDEWGSIYPILIKSKAFESWTADNKFLEEPGTHVRFQVGLVDIDSDLFKLLQNHLVVAFIAKGKVPDAAKFEGGQSDRHRVENVDEGLTVVVPKTQKQLVDVTQMCKVVCLQT